jgi:hypothetical protein
VRSCLGLVITVAPDETGWSYMGRTAPVRVCHEVALLRTRPFIRGGFGMSKTANVICWCIQAGQTIHRHDRPKHHISTHIGIGTLCSGHIQHSTSVGHRPCSCLPDSQRVRSIMNNLMVTLEALCYRRRDEIRTASSRYQRCRKVYASGCCFFSYEIEKLLDRSKDRISLSAASTK